jgi:hypothetical protein
MQKPPGKPGGFLFYLSKSLDGLEQSKIVKNPFLELSDRKRDYSEHRLDRDLIEKASMSYKHRLR